MKFVYYKWIICLFIGNWPFILSQIVHFTCLSGYTFCCKGLYISVRRGYCVPFSQGKPWMFQTSRNCSSLLSAHILSSWSKLELCLVFQWITLSLIWHLKIFFTALTNPDPVKARADECSTDPMCICYFCKQADSRDPSCHCYFCEREYA